METLEHRDVPSTVSITPGDDATEGGAPGTFIVTRTGDTSTAITVNITPSGTADPLADYPGAMPILFGAGDTTETSTITPMDDSLVEGTETITFTIASGDGYDIGDPSAATINLYDNDTAQVSVAELGDDPTEGSTGVFRISRTGGTLGDLPVNYTIGGTATPTTDYTALSGSATIPDGSDYVDVSMPTVVDNLVEGDETVIMTITDGGTAYTATSSATATVTIVDDPPVISVSRVDDGTEGVSSGHFEISRTGGDTTQAITVTYTVGGTAIAGSYYATLSGTATIAAGDASTEVTVDSADYTAATSTTTVSLTLNESSDYLINTPSDMLYIWRNLGDGIYYWTGLMDTSWENANNWLVDGVIPTAPPGSSDTVVFDSAYATQGSTLNGPMNTGYSVAEMDVNAGFSYTVTLMFPLSVGTLKMSGGTIDQPSSGFGSDLTVTANALWTAGTINSTANLGNLIFSGASATITPPGTGTLNTGDNLTITNGSDVVTTDGMITFANNAEVNADNGGINDIRISTSKGLKYMNVKQINIGANGFLYVGGPGEFDANGTPCLNSGGKVYVYGNGTMHFGGSVLVNGNVEDSSYLQAGSINAITSISGGSKIKVDKRMYIMSGMFFTQYNRALGEGNQIGTVDGDFCLSGSGSVSVSYSLATTAYGRFVVTGLSQISGGTYYPKIDGTKTGNCDLWQSQSAFFIDPNPDDSGVLTPQGTSGVNTISSGLWQILAGKSLSGSFKTTNLEFFKGPPARSYTILSVGQPSAGVALGTPK